MAKLLDLPLELILHILSYFPSHAPRFRGSEETRALLALCLTSKLLRSLAQPLLFRHFSAASDQRPLVYFAHTIACRPELGLHVQSISVETVDADTMRHLKHPMANMVESFREAIAKTELPEDRSRAWVQGISGLRVGTLAAFIISQTPNLSAFSIKSNGMEVDRDTELAQVLFVLCLGVEGSECHSSHSPRYVPNLKELSLEHWYGHPGLSAQVYTSLLSREGLESFHTAFASIEPDDDKTSSRIEPNSLSLSKLSLDRCDAKENGIDMLLSGCGSLRSFSLHTSLRVGPNDISPPKLESILCRHSSSFEELKLSYDVNNYNWEDWPERPSVCTFRNFTPFTRLKRLELTEATMIVDRNCLPLSLERYIILKAGQHILHRVSQLANSAKTAALPVLKLKLHVRPLYSTSYLTAWGKSKDLDSVRASLVEVLRGAKMTLLSKTYCGVFQGSVYTVKSLFVDEHGFHCESKPIIYGRGERH